MSPVTVLDTGVTIVVIVEENATIVEIIEQGPAGPPGLAGRVIEISDDYSQLPGEGSFFSTGDNELTLLSHLTATEPIMAKSRTGNFSLTNPFGNVILPSVTAGTVVLTSTQSVILWPTLDGWEYNG